MGYVEAGYLGCSLPPTTASRETAGRSGPRLLGVLPNRCGHEHGNELATQIIGDWSAVLLLAKDRGER